MAGKERFTTEQVIAAIKATKGLLTLAADKLGCDVDTMYNYRDRHPSVARAIKAERSRFVDIAEVKLFQAVNDGEAWAVKEVLRTLGKDRGYTERTEHSGPDGGPIRYQKAEDLTDDQLAAIASRSIGSRSGTPTA